VIPASRVWKTVAGYVQVFSYIDCPSPTHVVRLLRKFITPSLVKPHSSVTRSPLRTRESLYADKGSHLQQWSRTCMSADVSTRTLCTLYVVWKELLLT